MPQVFQVLRCYKCLVFQVHQVKKSSKWECKLCGEKQSIKRHYGIGTGKECRIHVQKLNALRNEIINQNPCHIDSDYDLNNMEDNLSNNVIVEEQTTKKSKWSNYVQENSETDVNRADEESETLFGQEVVLELIKNPKTGFRKRNINVAYENNLYQKLSNEDAVLCHPVEVPAKVNSKATTQKKQINKFIPPAAQLKSKWTEYNESEYVDQINNISSSDLSCMNTQINDNMGDLCTDNKTNNQLKSDTLRVCANSIKKYKNDGENDMNFHNQFLIEEHKQTSKWAEFMHNNEYDVGSQALECYPKKDTVSIKPRNFFSLCDDNDLDTILDI